MAPSISKTVPNTMACRYETDRDETLVAQAFATSSTSISVTHRTKAELSLTGTVIVGVQHGKEGTNSEDIGVLIQRHFVV